jgi:hypothetical protein
MDLDHIKKFLKAMKFKLVEGEASKWYKKYLMHDEYIITIDLTLTSSNHRVHILPNYPIKSDLSI